MKHLNSKFKEIAETYTDKANAAKALYRVLRLYVIEIGGDPDLEVTIRSPEENKSFGQHPCWYVGFEGGDYAWAIGASFTLSNDHWYTEPFYSFDLEFTDA